MRPVNITRFQWLRYNLFFLIEHFIGVRMSESLLGNAKKRLNGQILKNKEMESRGERFTEEVYEFNSFEEFRQRHPNPLKSAAVIRGVAKEWGAFEKWNNDFFRENYGDTSVSLVNNPGLVDSEDENKFEQSNLSSYLDTSKKSKRKYLRFSRLIDHNPELREDLDMEWLRQFMKMNWGSMGEQTFLFIGENGTGTPMHNGLAHTVFVQLKGRKKWSLYHASEGIFLNPLAERFLYFRSKANPYQYEDPNFPLLKYAKKYEFILEEGDVMWMPSLYWHHIENLTDHIAVAYKFNNVPDAFRVSKMLATLFFMATKPSILTSFIFNRKNKQDYVFSRDTRN